MGRIRGVYKDGKNQREVYEWEELEGGIWMGRIREIWITLYTVYFWFASNIENIP